MTQQIGPQSPEMLRILLPKAVQWAEANEKRILEAGTPLTNQQMGDARQIGVKAPE